MPLVKCPACQGRNPSSAQSCVHCGHIAPTCQDCSGSGVCRECDAEPTAGLPPCAKCAGTGRCPACKGNKVRWPETT